MGPENFSIVFKLIRDARHDMIDAMRDELGLEGGIRPTADYNPFAGTDLEEKYAKAERDRPGPWVFPTQQRYGRRSAHAAWSRPTAEMRGATPGLHLSGQFVRKL